MKIAVLNDDGTVITFNNVNWLDVENEPGVAELGYSSDAEGVQYQLHQRRPGKALADYFAPYVNEAGYPIESYEIREGDKYRVEYEIVRPTMELRTDDRMTATQTIKHTSERVSDGTDPRPRTFSLDTLLNVRYFLIERANPELSDEAEILENCMRGMEGIDPERTSSIAYQLVAMGSRMGGDS